MKIRALVVDDSPLDKKLITTFLKKLNFEGDYASNGEEAVEKLRNNQYDICFMDIEMPIMDGIEATKAIREEVSKDIPIIAVTAVEDFSLEKSLAAGMNDYVGKPVDLPILTDIIAKHCNPAT